MRRRFRGEIPNRARARFLGARTMFGLERHCIATASTGSRARPATRCGGRARANARLARWATFLGSAMVGKTARDDIFREFVGVGCNRKS